jgi:hypothetical protein
MMIIGCDLHTRYQQIAMVDTDAGELVERRLEHESGEARAFYAGLTGTVRVGIEATGHTAWFEALLAELGHELWMGDAAKIRAAVVRKQKMDARDAAHLLDMLCTNRFPQIWRPSLEERDLRVAGPPLPHPMLAASPFAVFEGTEDAIATSSAFDTSCVSVEKSSRRFPLSASCSRLSPVM